MKPWFEREAKIIKFPEPEKKVVQMPNVASYPDFMTGVSDLKARMGNGEISQASHDKLYTDLIHRFMKKESFETPWFLRESKLNEATGISGRKAGDVFQKIDDPKTELKFDQFKAFPDNKAKFDTPDEMNAQIKNIQTKIKDIVQVNVPTKSTAAFGLAVLDGTKGKVGFIKFGRDVQQVNNPGWWKNNQLTGFTPEFKSAKKVSSGMDPASVFGKATSRKNLLNPTQVVTQVDKALGPEFAVPISNMIKTKTLPTFTGMANSEKAIRDYFAEVFGPVALMNDVNNITGPYKEAEKYLGVNFSKCGIFYPTQQTNPLTDSYLIAPNGKEMGISSKGKTGANASIMSLAKNILDLTSNDPNNPLLKKYKFTVDVLTTLNENDYVEGPLIVAEKLKVINSKTAGLVRSLWYPKSEEKDIKKFPGLTKLYNVFGFKKSMNDQTFRLRFAILANLSKAVADKVNKTKGFGEGALNFLNQSQIIQAYTQTKTSEQDVVVTEIKTIYPPNFQGTLILKGGKNYSSTGAFGKIAFDFKPT